MAEKEKSKLRQMIEEYGIKDMDGVREFVKMLTAMANTSRSLSKSIRRTSLQLRTKPYFCALRA